MIHSDLRVETLLSRRGSAATLAHPPAVLITGLQRHEASARYEAGNPASLVKRYDLVIPRVHHKCRALDMRRDIEHIGLMESCNSFRALSGVAVFRTNRPGLVLLCTCIRHVHRHVELAIGRRSSVHIRSINLRWDCCSTACWAVNPRAIRAPRDLDLAREQDQTSHASRILCCELD